MLIIYYFSHRRSNTLISDWEFLFFPNRMDRPLYSRLPGFAEAKIFMFGYEMLAESMLDLILEQSAKRLLDQAVFNYSQTS